MPISLMVKYINLIDVPIIKLQYAVDDTLKDTVLFVINKIWCALIQPYHMHILYEVALISSLVL